MKRLYILIGVVMLILAACTDTPAADNNPDTPTAPPSLQGACDTAETFLKAWEDSDFSKMYSLISPKSQQTSQAQFAEAYQDVEKTMTLKPAGLSHTVDCKNSQLQGTTAVISYNMSFSTSAIGDFDDNNRTMRLILNQGWRIAWSTMDIFDQLADALPQADGKVRGATLSLDSTMPPRGTIYDRNGKPLAQDNQTEYFVTLLPGAYPKKAEDCFAEISTLFRRKYGDVVNENSGYTPQMFGKYGNPQGHLDQATYDAKHAELESVCNVKYSTTSTRGYFGNGLAVQLIGYVGGNPGDNPDYAEYPSDALVGRAGLELKFEKQLAGTPAKSLVIHGPDGMPLRTIKTVASTPSQDLKLTIDRDFQLKTEQAISDAYSAAGGHWAQFSTGAAAVVLNVNTGEVLAVASYPTFDVDLFNPHTLYVNPQDTINQWQKEDQAAPISPLTNRVTNKTSPLGSVFKIVSMAAAADTKTFSLSQVYVCNGQWDGRSLGDSGIRNDWIFLDPYAKDKKHGPITLVQALTASCDSYFWQVGATLNQKNGGLLSAYAQKIGLSDSGFTDLPQLTAYIPDPNTVQTRLGRQWEIGDALNTVIGQGDVQVTPMNVAHMMLAVANGGTLYKPYLVQSYGYPGQSPTVIGTPQKQGPTSIDPQVIRGIQQGLCDAVTDKKIGTAEWVYWNWDPKKVTVCGKTGTAQTGSPYPNGWFAAFAGPAGRPPEIAVVVLVERGREGSETAAPIVRRIVEAYYNIPFNDWPVEWSWKYVTMPDPGASDGAGPGAAPR